MKNRYYFITSIVVAIYAIVGFIAIPKIAKPQIEKAINENITQEATIQKVEFNPFLLKFSVHDLKIFDKNTTTISVEKLYIDFSILKSIDELHISFKDLQLVNPYINIIENENGEINLQKLAKESKPKKETKGTSSSDIKFQIYRTILENAKIDFTKYIKDEEPFKLNVDKLNYTFYDMGTYRNTLASHSLRILINKNTELIVNGGLRLDPFKMHGNIELKNLRPKDLLTYQKDILNFDINEKAFLDLKFGYKVDATKGLNLSLNDTYLNINHLDITQNKDSILSLKHLSLDNLYLQYPKNNVDIDQLYIDSLNSKVIQDKNGVLNFANLVKQEQTQTASKPIKVEEVKASEQKYKETKKAKTVVTNTKTNPWKVNLKKLDIKNSNISFQDLANALFVDTKNINLDLSNFKLVGSDFTLDKLALTKPTISLKDKKNSLEIANKGLELNISNIASKDSNIKVEKIALNDEQILVKDLKSRLNITTNKPKIELNQLNQKAQDINLDTLAFALSSLQFRDLKNRVNIDTKAINANLKEIKKQETTTTVKTATLTTPAINFKDRRNSLAVFTKKTTLSVSDILNSRNKTTIKNAVVKNPSVYFNDYKAKLKVVSNRINLNANNFKLENGNINLNKAKLRTSSVKVDDKINKTKITAKNINIIATKTSMIKQKLKVAILSLTKPDIYFVDNKTNKTIVAKKMSLKINNISSYKNLLYVSKVNLLEPDLEFKDLNSKTDVIAKNIFLNVQKISHKNNKLKIVKSSINKPYISVTLGKKEKVEEDKETTTKQEEVKVTKVEEKKKSDFSFEIGPIKIKDAKMTFEDKNLPIPFKTDITKLEGEFSELNSSSSKPTKMKLEGTVDEYGYTRITGIVDINDIKLLTDTNLLFKNIAIKNFTPYSGKFVGREIAQGKLNLDLKYNIKKSDLKASNSIIISDIKLGNKVESPDAVDLPLELAIALLEDSEGVIDIELPISGNVDDPQFSIAPIVWKVFTNLITKAITAPFKLLAAAFGFSEDSIKSLEFEFGKSNILVSEKESLDNIAKILTKKPKLAINIAPSYHKTKDHAALQDIKFEKFLEKEMDEIPEGDEYQEALEDLYEDVDGVEDLEKVEKRFTKIDKNKDEHFDKDSYVEYLRKFLASRFEVKPNELEALAKKRVKNIVKYLKEDKKIEANKINVLKDFAIHEKKEEKWAIFDLDVAVKK